MAPCDMSKTLQTKEETLDTAISIDYDCSATLGNQLGTYLQASRAPAMQNPELSPYLLPRFKLAGTQMTLLNLRSCIFPLKTTRAWDCCCQTQRSSSAPQLAPGGRLLAFPAKRAQ